MASKGDILIKYKKAYPDFESQSINRLEELKRSFSNEKALYKENLDNLSNKLKINQNKYFDLLNDRFLHHIDNQVLLENKFKEIKNEFNEDINYEMVSLDQKIDEEHKIFEDILEQFETRKQDALNIYLQLTKQNNDHIDEEMKVHYLFIAKEEKKLKLFKTEYDDLSAKLNNKMIWTIEKSKNAIIQLKNDLSQIDKDDLISLNQKILLSLTDLRGTRNDINVLFKETSNSLNKYRENIFGIRDIKQKPYTEINQKLIQKLIKQIRLANQNKIKYQRIIKSDLLESQNKLYPHILNAYQEHRKDDLEKYILQVETLEEKADYLINKIEKITNYNISTYQNRIKEIKIEAFTRNEEIKFSYSVPMKYIENAINIYSNYNFYFNQGFDDLDKLLSQLINFSQEFNEIRDDEVLNIKKDLADYQTNFLSLIKNTSEKLSELLYHIDDIAHQITTLESKNRIEISEVKKEIINVDIKGDYIKYLESLNSDYVLANKQSKTRLKRINIHKLYYDKTLEIYQTAIKLDEDIESAMLHQYFNHDVNEIETNSHRDYYDYYLSQLDLFYGHQTNLLEVFMMMMKERVSQSIKAQNYHLAKGFFDYESNINHKIDVKDKVLLEYINLSQRNIELNNQETKNFIQYLSEQGKAYSTLTYLEKTRINLYKQLNQNYSNKTALISQYIIDSFSEKKNIIRFVKSLFKEMKTNKKSQLVNLHHKPEMADQLIDDQNDFKSILLTITSVYYETINYAYKNHASASIEKLNNFYDDHLFNFTEKSIQTIDKLSKSKREKYKFNLLNDYMIEVIDQLDKAKSFFLKTIASIHDFVLKGWAEQIAVVKVHLEDQRNIIDKQFNQLDNKTLNYQNQIHSQQKLIKKLAEDLNHWVTEKVSESNKTFINYTKNQIESIEFLNKITTKLIQKNDVQLHQLFKQIDNEILKQYQVMMADYKEQKSMIDDLKQKLLFDANVENQYIDFTTEKTVNDILITKEQLQRQMDLMPSERRTRLLNLELNYQKAFQTQQDDLLQKYSQIEKDKFTSVPLLEKKITDIENRLFDDFKELYTTHQNLEKKYLNQYINSNDLFISLHKNYKNESVKSALGYDEELDQPLKDLVAVEQSIIDKTDIIHHEISQKTQSKMTDIRKTNQISQSKQDRIINS